MDAGKVCGQIVIEMVKTYVDSPLDGEQCGFRNGGGCPDQDFTLKSVAKK